MTARLTKILAPIVCFRLNFRKKITSVWQTSKGAVIGHRNMEEDKVTSDFHP